jgi:RNA polymerase sigma factor (sigma-70 family)
MVVVMRSPVRPAQLWAATAAPTPPSGALSDDASSDEALLAGFAASDPAATSAFVARYQRRVYGLALTIVGDARTAEDAAQEAMVRAWRRADTFDVRRGRVDSWLLSITRNVAIDTIRKRRAVVVAPDEMLGLTPPAPGRDPGDVVALHDDLEWLHAALADLPEEQRRAVVLAGVWGLSAREISEQDEIPLGTAKTRIRIALRRLRDALHERESTEPDARVEPCT